jgi:hypothetical protein
VTRSRYILGRGRCDVLFAVCLSIRSSSRLGSNCDDGEDGVALPKTSHICENSVSIVSGPIHGHGKNYIRARVTLFSFSFSCFEGKLLMGVVHNVDLGFLGLWSFGVLGFSVPSVNVSDGLWMYKRVRTILTITSFV